MKTIAIEHNGHHYLIRYTDEYEAEAGRLAAKWVVALTWSLGCDCEIDLRCQEDESCSGA